MECDFSHWQLVRNLKLDLSVERWALGVGRSFTLSLKLPLRSFPVQPRGGIASRTAALAVAACIFAAGAFAQTARPTALPQDHAYQVVLRDYLATLTEADFTLELKPLAFDEAWVADDEALHRLWIVSRALPDTLGLTLAADNFLLASIESKEGVLMRAGRRGSQGIPGVSIHPDDTVWWAGWDYPGIPYRVSRAVRNRAFVVAAVDMIMLDWLHTSGTHWVNNARRSDFLGGTLAWLAHVYHDVRDDLPAPVRTAYEQGLATFVGRLTKWGPTGVCDNMDMKAHVGLAYLAATLKEGPVVDEARAYVARALRLVHPAGMIRDAGGLDATYNGVALFDLAWAASVSEWPEFRETLRRMSDLKAHLTLPEPDGANFFGPSHFSTRTSNDAANDQWTGGYHRDLAIAMRNDEALYLMYGGRAGRGPHWAAPERDVMLAEARRKLEVFNEQSLQPAMQRFTVWEAGWWGSGRANFAHDYYAKGFYDRLRTLRDTRDPLALPPFSRPGATFIRTFPDPALPDIPTNEQNAFLVARFADYGAVIYSGPIGRTSYMNLAGGALSAFWTPAGGSILLGRTGRPVNPEQSRQTWADWRLWPTHALSGATPSGDAFSTARVRRRVSTVAYEIGAESAVVTVGGPIGKQHDGSRAAQNGCLAGAVRYQRRFALDAKGIAVETRLESDGTDAVTDLCEILPLLLKETREQTPPRRPAELGEVRHRVRFQVGDTLTNATETFVDGVSAVHVERFAGSAVIRFETPQRVRLGEVWTDNFQSRMAVQNLLIDLLGPHSQPVPLPNATLRYRIEPGLAGNPSPDNGKKVK
jgi:hypothetical protein